MKVKELIELLESCPEDTEVVSHHEEDQSYRYVQSADYQPPKVQKMKRNGKMVESIIGGTLTLSDAGPKNRPNDIETLKEILAHIIPTFEFDYDIDCSVEKEVIERLIHKLEDES